MAIPKVNQNFSLMVILTLHTFVLWPTSGMSLMVKCNELDCDTSQAFPLRLNINQDGSLIDLQGNAISFDNLEKREITIQIPPDSKVPFATIERTLQNVEKRGIKLLRIVAPSYVLAAGQLFYAVPESNSEFGHVAEPPPGSPRLFPKGMQIQGFDMSVRPAQLSVDINSFRFSRVGALRCLVDILCA
jgi:hypothetical protein